MNQEDRQRLQRSQSRQLVNKLRRLQSDALRYGVDLTPRFAVMIREAEQEIAERRAA